MVSCDGKDAVDVTTDRHAHPAFGVRDILEGWK